MFWTFSYSHTYLPSVHHFAPYGTIRTSSLVSTSFNLQTRAAADGAGRSRPMALSRHGHKFLRRLSSEATVSFSTLAGRELAPPSSLHRLVRGNLMLHLTGSHCVLRLALLCSVAQARGPPPSSNSVRARCGELRTRGRWRQQSQTHACVLFSCSVRRRQILAPCATQMCLFLAPYCVISTLGRFS